MSVLTDFRNPPAEYRFAPFWFWNHELKLDELERQIMEMKEKGCGGFIMHARHGLLTPYMGREWMDAIEHCVRVAEREKMWAWLYDEDNWPSGTVGMRLAREHPEYRMSQLWASEEIRLVKGEEVDREVELGDGLFCVLAIPMTGEGEAALGREKDITSRVKKGRLSYTARSAQETVVVFVRSYFRGNFHDGYLDTLNREACAWFISETHERYAERLGRLLGRSVKGIFTDEPGMVYTYRERTIPFTDELPKRFKKEHGISLEEALPALYFEAGKETPRIRLMLHRTVQSMYIEAFFKPIWDWCRRHSIRSIGHVNTEGELTDQVRNQGDYFASAEYMHYAGVDTLFESTFKSGGMSNNHMASKLASSAEHLLERERTMAESFGVAASWELTLSTLKWLGDFQAVLGINYFMPHAAYYSLAGFRKWECPPDESYHVSYWPFYRLFADHLARLSAVLHGGEHLAPVALFMPVSAMAATQNPDTEHWWIEPARRNPAARAIHSSFETSAEWLSRNQLDFDVVTEDILSRGTVGNDGRLRIHNRKGKVLETFRALVLPRARALGRETMDRLEEWAKAGLVIVWGDELPSQSPEAGADEELAARARAMLAMKNVAESSTADGAFVGELRSRIESDVDVGDIRDILYVMKDKEDRRFVMLSNSSRERGYYRVRVRVRAEGVAHVMDTLTGEVRCQPSAVQDGDWVEMVLDFPPTVSHLLMFAKRRATKVDVSPRLESVEESRLALGDQWTFVAEGGNYFPLRRWTSESAGVVVRADKWAAFRKTYRTEFHAAVSPTQATLLADGLFDQYLTVNSIRLDVHVEINGHELTEWKEGTHWDRLVPEVDVTSLIRQGTNEVLVWADSNFRANVNVDQPLYLAGEFTVAGTGAHEVLSVARHTVHSGSWASQGFPYFSGIGRYEQEFRVPEELADERLFLEFEDVGHVVQVLINDVEAGVLPWRPWSIEVTGRVRAGRNRLTLRVANAMSNVFLLRPDPSGVLGKVTLVAKRPVGGVVASGQD